MCESEYTWFNPVTAAPTTAPPSAPSAPKKGKVKKNKKYGCDKCEYRTSQRQSLVQHTLAVHEKVKPYPCPYEGCDYRCARKQNMDKHVAGVHQKLRPFACPICSKVNKLNIYISIKHIKNTRSFRQLHILL